MKQREGTDFCTIKINTKQILKQKKKEVFSLKISLMSQKFVISALTNLKYLVLFWILIFRGK